MPDLIEAATQLLEFVAFEFSEFDEGGACLAIDLCPECEVHGCIDRKIHALRAALAKAGVTP